MKNFLLFQTFVTPTFLIIFYYIGAIVIPFVSYFIAKWIHTNYFKKLENTIKQNITQQQRFVLYAISLLCFFCMELFWRMMFEFFIAYFDMHDALMKLNLSN